MGVAAGQFVFMVFVCLGHLQEIFCFLCSRVRLKSLIWDQMSTVRLYFLVPMAPSRVISHAQRHTFSGYGVSLGPAFDDYASFSSKEVTKPENK